MGRGGERRMEGWREGDNRRGGEMNISGIIINFRSYKYGVVKPGF
jgi:hypothetical protein